MLMEDQEDEPEIETVQPPRQDGGRPGGEAEAGVGQEGGDSDPELDELLDQSLGEFGKHIPQAPKLTPPTSQSPMMPRGASEPGAKTTPTTPPTSQQQPHPPAMDGAEMDEMFSAEFAAEAEAQLSEAMKMLSSENPEIWQEFETFAKSMGLDDVGEGFVPPAFAAASKGESSVDASSQGATGEKGSLQGATGGKGSGEDPQKSQGSSTLEQKLDETIRKMQDNATRLGPEASQPEGLGDMLSQLDLGSEEGEDHFMKMMQGMMSTLLSKEVLYPSLVDLCKQYPDWLSSHQGKVSDEDYQRYSKQLEIMKTICAEFDSPAQSEQASSERILELMQQLQQYGQPPDDLAGENMQQAGIPPGLRNLMSGSDPQNCTIM